MSAPFPETAVSRDPQGQQVFAGRDQTWRNIPERGQYIALWYDPSTHPNPETIVVSERKDGQLVPLLPKRTVADVAPEYRPFIRSDGSILTGDEFKDRYKRWQEDSFKFHGARVGKGWNAEFQPIPSPYKITALGVDPSNPRKYRKIGYDPNATAGARPSELHNSDGEAIPKDRMEMLVEAYQNPVHRKALKPFEIEEVEAHLQGQGGGDTDGTQAKLSLLTTLLHAGDLTQEQYVQRVEQLTGNVRVKSEPKVPDASDPVSLQSLPSDQPTRKGGRAKLRRACGREISKSGFRIHKRSCTPCQEAEDS